MTSTSVKDVGSAFTGLYTGSTQSAGMSAGVASFKQVWNSQVGKDNDTSAADMQTTAKKTDFEAEASGVDSQVEKPKSSAEEVERETEVGKESAVEEKATETAKTETSENENSELSEEEMQAAMEVLYTAAAELMQSVAETFGVTLEELQTTMDELGMTATDVLDEVKLGELMLRLGGASDSYALVTDETLYDNYRMLMGQQKEALETVAKELGVDESQLDTLIAGELQSETVVVEDVSDEMISRPSETDGTELNMVVETSDEMPVIDNAGQTGQSTAGEERNREQSSGEKPSEAPVSKQPNEFVAQDVTMDNMQVQVQQTESVYTSTSWDADTQNIMRQIMDYMKIQVNAETTDLEMQLHPASLGTIRVNIASNGGVMTANFVTENETVKAALESQMIQLRESFAEQGVKVEAIEVTVQTHEFEQNLEQGRGRNNQESGTRRNRTRRINLNDPLTMENLDEEDALAAELLTAEGSTVDYTA